MSENDLNKGVGRSLILAGLGDVGAQLDRCFLPLGLVLESGFSSRKYVGAVNGRFITVTIAPRTHNQYITGEIRYRKFAGLWMDISVTTPVMTRLMLGQPKGMARRFVAFVQQWRGNKPVPHLPAAYDELVAFAHDPAWGETFLRDTAVQNYLTTLLHDPNLPPGAAIHLSPGSPTHLGSPGRWMWTTPALPDDFTPESAERWVTSLGHLAALAEQSPLLTAVPPTWLERQNPGTTAFLLTAVLLFGIPFLLFTCCMVPAFILIFLSGK